ncbi:transglycosylase [Sediminicoccus sp. KRV36]|uniref:transglycosylase n=1 Tax=Sediminicoccus sp. KRV36 TaxID=3133721 RepID=UPI00200EE5EB|nr:transglycosylase [Sediminicoccus rosea]UPY39033.1 transglycosylase [Sediminicoccus rosea]
MSQPARRATTAPRATTAQRSTAPRRDTGTRSAHRGRARPPAGTPRMRDAPQELIPVLVAETSPRTSQLSPRAACLQATQRAEQVHGLPTGLLTAIALAESGLHAYALSIGGRAHFPETEEAARALVDGAAPRRSIMAGCVQVNARVHARNSHWPLNPDASADWAGGMMARWARETGSWSTALRRWHGGSPASTQRLVCRVKAKMEVTSPGSDVFDDWSCNTGHAERTRRNGAVHLATAQRQTQ